MITVVYRGILGDFLRFIGKFLTFYRDLYEISS